jgi:epoxide hydrolase-like predicted phosphatase
MSMGELDESLKSRGYNGELGTCSEPEWLGTLCEIAGINQTEAEEFMHDLWEEYLGTLNVELVAYFSDLRPRYQTAILSNSFLGARRRQQERYKIDDMTDLVIYSHEEGIAKPDRRVYQLACKRLGIQPGEMIFLDDLEPNVAAAREFGIHAILFCETIQAIAEIQALLQA